MEHIRFVIDNTGWKYEQASKYFLDINVITLKELQNNRHQVKPS